ncbi:unnamed protein product [Microthlaspi erraticum]|uniref:DUF1985 domain-containing protein n=1 Tax=Microthlaspi erraticum TaxID=1685480 RepID=A0A6D2HMM3_9BRAS|nr:unnamed protein product [Microthlaspi erraticum]
MSILTDLANGVKAEYTEVKRDPLFAKIIAIHENRLHFSAKLVHSFMTRQLVTAKKHELWFVFARRPLRFSLQEFHAVTGLKCVADGNSEETNWVDDGGFWNTMLKTRGKISFETIRKKHLQEANTWTRVDRLRLVYFCVVGLLMAIDEKSFVSHEYIRRIMDIDKLRAYPWGLRSFDHLVDGVIKARSDLSKPSYVLQGFQEIIDLEKTLRKNGLVLYSFISATGNMDVIRDQDFVRTDEMRDERVDRMEQLISQNHDWSKRLWEAEEPVDTAHAPAPAPASAPAIAPASAAQTESEVVHNEGGESTEDFRTPCGEVTSSSGSRTRKRKVIDKGAEERKKQLLF